MRLSFARLSLVILMATAAGYSAEDKQERDRGHDWETEIRFPDRCVNYEFEIDSIPYSELTNITYSDKTVNNPSGPVDGDGIVMTKYKGELYYQPVNMCHRAFEIVAAYRKTGDSTYLNLAQRHIERLIKESIEYDGAIYYTYAMDHKVHSMDRAPLNAPWHSGMAQGEILGLMTRMFWATGDSSYIDYAQKTFKSFLRPRGDCKPWTVFVDSLGCYWIEEYPTEPPSMTLNGFIYGFFGVYDYYLLTGSDEVKKVLTDCLSTLKNYIPCYRRPGQASFYGLQFRHWSQPYHGVHVKQLRQLYKITNDEFFKQWADIFEEDFN